MSDSLESTEQKGTMKPNVSPEELLALSAYLDDALPAPDRAALEHRLATDTNLQRELESLRQTVRLLALLPAIKAPRDFRLDPAIYGDQAAPKVIRPALWQRIGLAIAALLMLVSGLGIGLQLLTSGGADEDTSFEVADNADNTANGAALTTAVAQDVPTAAPTLGVTFASLPSDIITKGTATAIAVDVQQSVTEAVENDAQTPALTDIAVVATDPSPPTASPRPTLRPTEQIETFDTTHSDGTSMAGAPPIAATVTALSTYFVESAMALPTSLPPTQDAADPESILQEAHDQEIQQDGQQDGQPILPAAAETSPTLGIATGSSAAPGNDTQTEADRGVEDETTENTGTDMNDAASPDMAGEEAPSVNRSFDPPAANAVISRLVSAVRVLIWQLLFNLIEVLVGNVSY